MADKKYILDVEVESTSDSLKEAIKDLERMVELKEKLKGSVGGISDEDINNLKKAAQAQDELNEKIKNQKKVVKEKTEEELRATAARQLQSKAEREAIDLLKLEAIASDKALGKLERLEARNKLLVIARKKLVETDKDYEKVLKKINTELDKNNAEIKDSLDLAGKQQKNIGNYKSALEGLPSSLRGAAQGVEGLGESFKALLSNPLVLVLSLITGALYGLYKAFTKTDEGATAMEGVTRTLGLVLDKLVGVALSVGKALVSMFTDPMKALSDFSDFLVGQFKNRLSAILLFNQAIQVMTVDAKLGFSLATDAIAQFATGVEGVVYKVKKVATEMNELNKEGQLMAQMFDDLSDAEREYSIIATKNEKDITRLIIASKNRTKSDAERIAFLDEATRLEEANFKQELEFAKKKLGLIALENQKIIENRKLKDVNASLSDDERQKEVDAINEITKLEQESFNLQEKINNRRDALLKEIEDDREKRNNAELERIEKERAAKEKAINEEIKLTNKLRQTQNDLLKEEKDRNAIIDKEEEERLKQKQEDINSFYDSQKKKAEETAAAQKKAFEETIKATDFAVSKIGDALDKRSEARLDAIDKEEAANETALERQIKRADEGLQNDVESYQLKQAELEKAKAEQLKKDVRREKIISYYNLLSGYAKSDSKTALKNAVRDIALSEGITAAFAEKGGIVGEVSDTTTLGSSRTHGAGNDRLVMADKREGILTVSEMNNLGGRDGFYNLKAMLNNPISDDILFPKVPVFMGAKIGSNELERKLDTLITITKNKPVNHTSLDNVGNAITETFENGMKRTLKVISRKPRLR